MGLINCTQLRKESLSLRISEQKPIKLKTKGTKALGKKPTRREYQRTVGQLQIMQHMYNENTRRRKRKGTEKILNNERISPNYC